MISFAGGRIFFLFTDFDAFAVGKLGALAKLRGFRRPEAEAFFGRLRAALLGCRDVAEVLEGLMENVAKRGALEKEEVEGVFAG